MPDFKQLPVSIRNLRARLQVLQRPTVWGSAAVLLLAIFFLAEYWGDPKQYASADRSSNYTRPNPLRPTALDPYSSDGADFGNLPGLSNNFASPSQPSGTRPTNPNAQTGSTRSNLFQSPSSLDSSLSKQPENALDPVLSSLDSADRNSSSTAPGLLDDLGAGSSASAGTSSRQGGNSAIANPLQSALDRYGSSTGNSATGDSATSNTLGDRLTNPSQVAPYSSPNSSVGQPGTEQSSTSPSPAGRSFSQFSSGQSFAQPYIPQNSPPPGTTGYVVPPAFRTAPTGNEGNSSSSGLGFSGFSNSQPVPGAATPQFAPSRQTQGYGYTSSGSSSNSGYSSTPSGTPSGTQYQSPQSSTSSFSVPRATPGRYIGGGEINTFSNP